MTSLETLEPGDLNQVLNRKILKRARGYVNRVRNQTRNGRTLQADVRGTRLYEVEIDVTEGGIHAVCSCPYDWGGYCKHIGAVLLKWIQSPDSFAIESAAPRTTDGLIETFPVEPPPTAEPEELPTWLAASFEERYERADLYLHEWLSEYKVQELRQMAKDQNWSISGTRKDDIIRQIMRQMLQPGAFLKTLHSLDSEHLQVYHALTTLYPGISYQETHLKNLAEQWGKLTTHKKITTYTDHLCSAGLALPARLGDGYFYQIAFIPTSVWRLLPPSLAERIPEADLPSHSESTLHLAAPKSFLQSVHQILRLLEQNQPPLRTPMPRPRLEKYHDFLKTWDYVPEEIHQAINENKFQGHNQKLELTVPPPRPPLPDESIEILAPMAGGESQLNFIYHLLVTAGLLQKGSPVTVWPEGKAQFFRQDEAMQWAILLNTYFELTGWSELWLVLAEESSLQLRRTNENIYNPLKPKTLYDMLTVFRSQVLHMLACLPNDKWYSVSEIAGLLKILVPRFDNRCWSRARYGGDNLPAWFLAKDGRFLNTNTNQENWNDSFGEFIHQIIQGPLHWLGAADIALEHGRLIAFRLHGLHDLFFDKVESVPLVNTLASEKAAAVPAQTEAEPITIEKNTIVVDPKAISAQAHNYFDTIARLESVDPARFVYRLDPTAVHQAFEAGQTLSQMLEGWQKWLDISMPVAIQNQLTSWWNAYGQVRLYNDVTVIEFGDEYALAEMKATTSLEKHLIAEISPSLVIVQENAIDTLVSELEKAGYTPKKADSV